jgi:hypothetical protein
MGGASRPALSDHAARARAAARVRVLLDFLRARISQWDWGGMRRDQGAL